VDVTPLIDVTTSLAVWSVTGIVTARLHVDKVVPVVHVNAGREPVHRVTVVIGTQDVTNSAVKGVHQATVFKLVDIVHLVSTDFGETNVTNDVVMTAMSPVFS